MLRGAFGSQLKQLACVYPDEPDCRTCSLRHACAYAFVFEPCIEKKPPQFLRGLDTAPRPYTFYCPDFTENFSPDAGFLFDFTLIGTACAWYREAIIAILKMVQAGLSIRRHPFTVQAIHMFTGSEEEWQTVYDGNSMRSEPLEPVPIPQSENLPSPLRLDFISPLRVKINGQYADRITFRQLTFQMLRRVLELAYFYAPDQPLDWEFNHLLRAADAIRVADQHFKWADWERHSNRQKTDMQMGGMLGHMTLAGDLEPWRELIHAARWLHVGKGTVMGLGRVEISDKNT
ncbi:CRISPR system precrRNA processing endoribonuclease RAMP protein Cas6 [bacterium]|nr:CRISPR system precrRNA processing endoribonuclease RAMP protein Cas6 [bacterium]